MGVLDEYTYTSKREKTRMEKKKSFHVYLNII